MWMLQNKLKLNYGKREFLYFHPHHKKVLDSTTSIKIGDDTIETSDSAKDLGVLLDCDLTLSPYITTIC